MEKRHQFYLFAVPDFVVDFAVHELRLGRAVVFFSVGTASTPQGFAQIGASDQHPQLIFDVFGSGGKHGALVEVAEPPEDVERIFILLQVAQYR